MIKALLFLLLVTSTLFAQESLVLDLPKDNRLLEIINLKEKGTFLITGKDASAVDNKIKLKSGDLQTRFKYISPDLKLVWDKPFTLEPDNLVENYYVASSDSFIYFVEVLSGTLTKSNYLISQIDYSGTTRIFEYNVPFKIDKLYDLYCDKDYLYFFYDEFKDSKKPYHFLGIRHNNFKIMSVDIALPKIPKKKEELSYDRRIFVGIHNDLFYFYSKSAKSSNSCSYNFTLVNRKGDIANTFVLESTLENNQYIAPTNNPHINQSWTDGDFNFVPAGEVIYPAIGSLGDVYMDFDHGAIYLFGNYSSEPFNNMGGPGKIEGIFVNKFDMNGTTVWKKNIPFTKTMKDPLLRTSSYQDRTLYFDIDPNSGNIALDISFTSTKKRHSMILNKSGEYLKTNTGETGAIPDVDRGILRTPQTFKGDVSPLFKKANPFMEGVDTKAMRKMEELSKLSLKKVAANKLKNSVYAPYSNLYYISKSKNEETLIESNFGEGKINLYLFRY